MSTCFKVYSEENTVEIIVRNIFKQVFLCYKICKCSNALPQDSTEAGSAFLLEVQTWSVSKHIDLTNELKISDGILGSCGNR